MVASNTQRVEQRRDPFQKLRERFEAACKSNGAFLARHEPPEVRWRSLVLLELLKEGLESLRRSLNDPAENDITWDNLWIEAQYAVAWNWKKQQPDLCGVRANGSAPKQLAGQALAKALVAHKRLHVFQILTNMAVSFRRNQTLLDIPAPPPILTLDLDDTSSSQDASGELSEQLRQITDITFKGEAEGDPYEGSLVVEFRSLVVDEDEKSAYYPVEIGIVLGSIAPGAHRGEREPATRDIPNPDSWAHEEQENFWNALFNALDDQLRILKAPPTEAAREQATKTPPMGPRVVPTRRSIMSPVPVPRAGVKHTAGLALTRGLGRMFSGFDKVPDLDLRGESATTEAEALFWQHLDQFLNSATSDRKDQSWECIEENNKKIVVLHGFTEKQAQQLWDDFARSLNKGQGGPGIQVTAPTLETGTRFDNDENSVVVEARMTFWPDEALRDRDGWQVSPVRFRSEGSPGYLALLKGHEPRPYFAEGWLWIPRATEREGFRIGGLSTLLFPEGRAALERTKQRELHDYEAELNRIFLHPDLYQDQDTRAVQQLRAGIRRVQNWLRNLSTYDISHDLILCIFEAFFWQRDAWINQALRMPDGREIDTTPWRIIYLDSDDLRIRLDPSERWGANWRKRLFEKLEALTTFERQTRSHTGRKIDVGDRFLGRVIDGYQGVAEGSAPETDSGLGLTRVLKRAGAFPIDAFFVEISVDFMERLVTWAVDETGKVHWGIDAAKAAERAALVHYPEDPKKARRLAEAKLQEARTSPYYEHSPRLLTLGNLEGWPVERKLLANALLQEVTPNSEQYRDSKGKTRKRRIQNKHGGKEALINISGSEYVSCNGTHAHGYRARTWLSKVGYQKRRGKEGWTQAFRSFVADLEALMLALDLHLALKDDDCDTNAVIQRLHALRRTPSKARDVVIRAYLPLDLEDRLRSRLAEVGIEAIDVDESRPAIDLPATPNGLSPSQIRTARKRAKMTQASLAEKIGVTQGLLSQWERAREPISEERMERLREALGDHIEAEDQG